MSSRDKNTLTRVAKHILFEFNEKDVVDRFTLYDRPGPKLNNMEATADQQAQTTIGSEVPLKPSVLMATQNFGERPPVEDDEYLPANRKELSNAASVISSMVPPDQIDFFYDGLHKLFTAAQDREGSLDADEAENNEEQKMKRPVSVKLKQKLKKENYEAAPKHDAGDEVWAQAVSVWNHLQKTGQDVPLDTIYNALKTPGAAPAGSPPPPPQPVVQAERARIVALLRKVILEASKGDINSIFSGRPESREYADYGVLTPNPQAASDALRRLGYNISAEEIKAGLKAATPPVAGDKKYRPAPPAPPVEKKTSEWRKGLGAVDPKKSLEYMSNVLDYSSPSGARQAAIIIKRRHDRIAALLEDPDASESLDDLREVLKDDMFDILQRKKLVSAESAEAWKKYPEELGLYEHPAFRTLIGNVLDVFHKEEEKAIQSSIRTAMSKVKVKSPDTGKTLSVSLTGPVSDTLFNQIVGGSDPDFEYVQKRLMTKDGLSANEASVLSAAIKKAFLRVRQDVGLDTNAEDFQGEDIISAALDDWMKKSEKDKEKFVMKVSDSLKEDQKMFKREKEYINSIGKNADPTDASADDYAAYEPPPPGSAPLSGWARAGQRERERIENAIAGRKKVKDREEADLARRRAEQGIDPAAPPVRGRGRPRKEQPVVPPAAPEVTSEPVDRVSPLRRKKP